MTVMVIVVFDRRGDRIFPFQEFRDLRKPFAREKIFELMMCFLGKWNVPGNRSKRATDFFEWTRLARMLTVEPAIPRYRLRLENAHSLCDSNNIYILC